MKAINEYDADGRLTYSRDSYGYEAWWERDAAGRVIHYRNTEGYEEWYEYDADGRVIHCRNSNGYEEWYECDAAGRIIHWRNRFRKTGKLPRSLRPSAVTSSLASTVPRPGHQLTIESAWYTSR